MQAISEIYISYTMLYTDIFTAPCVLLNLLYLNAWFNIHAQNVESQTVWKVQHSETEKDFFVVRRIKSSF